MRSGKKVNNAGEMKSSIRVPNMMQGLEGEYMYIYYFTLN